MLLPISDNLTEAAFQEKIQAIQFAVVLMGAVIEKGLNQAQKAAQKAPVGFAHGAQE